MSQEPTEQTKLGPGFDAVGVSTAIDQDYPNDWEMEDTASSSVRVVGEVVPETDVSSLGLSPQVALSADSLRNVTGTGTAAAQNPGDADSGSMFDWVSGVNVAETTASGLQPPSNVRHPKESFATSRRSRSKSPHGRIGRDLSPKSHTVELRARMARVRVTGALRTRHNPASQRLRRSSVSRIGGAAACEAASCEQSFFGKRSTDGAINAKRRSVRFTCSTSRKPGVRHAVHRQE